MLGANISAFSHYHVAVSSREKPLILSVKGIDLSELSCFEVDYFCV